MVHDVMVIFYPVFPKTESFAKISFQGLGIEVEHWLKMGETVHTRLAASPPFH